MKPLIVIPADCRIQGQQKIHMVSEKYLRAVTDAVRGIPFIIPVIADSISLDDVLNHADGLLLPGSPSNIEPHHYGALPSVPGTEHDPARDAFTLPLIRAALLRGIPIFAICRGFQEMNVALGGTLHQRVHEITGMNDHREDQFQSLEVQYGPAHDVRILPGGLLASLLDRPKLQVNSLHWQGVDRLASGVQIEAIADDGLVEAFTIPKAHAFNLAVQWHPEWHVTTNTDSMALFEAFGNACRAHMSEGA